ncbi:MAG: WYL domain-containing protein [Spirochaetia bacterium]|nr:WYL domain-containing protein [Spirochaetia bacterium]
MKKKEVVRKLNKKMLERIIIIHNAIKSGAYPDVQKLQDFYCKQTGYENVGKATINRDIDTLRTYFQAPLEFDRRMDGYFYSDKNWKLALNNISTEDVFYLSAAKTLLSSFEGTPMYEAIAQVIDFITDTQMAGKSSLLKRIAVPPAPQVYTDKTIWENILFALQNNAIIEFDYNVRWNPETTHRRVRPYQLLMDEGTYYIFGYAEERKAERIFALNRIKKLTVTKDYFQLPADYEFHNRCGGGRFGLFMSKGADHFVIDFYGDARQYVKDRVWADDQVIKDFPKEDKVRISFSSTQVLKVSEWILAQGMNAIPRKPQWFVDKWKLQVKGMAKNAKL